MTLLSQAATISAVIIGAVWVGIGVKWGQDIYDYVIRPRFKKWLRHFKKLKINWKP